MGQKDNERVVGMMVSFPRKVNQCVKLMATRYLRDTRIRPHYLMFILQIGLEGGVSQRDLNERMFYDKSFISTVVRELIDLGYVRNEGSGKTNSLYLTDSGRDIHAMSVMMFDIMDRNLFECLDEEEVGTLLRIMDKMDSQIDRFMESYSREDS